MSDGSVVFKNFHPSPAGLAPLTQMPPRRQPAPPPSPIPRRSAASPQQPPLQQQQPLSAPPSSQPPASPVRLSSSTDTSLAANMTATTTALPADALTAAAASPSTAQARTLPPRSPSATGLEDAYVQFIFYCNPGIAAGQNANMLRHGFRSMPRSDGRDFAVDTLFALIRRLEARELESWAQLVVELGVEPPDLARSQSSQKVQQFAVRLKRWLHAYHIDAFFYYLLGKPCEYYTQVPSETEPIAGNTRDGVPPENDLVIRALLPEWRPKRGRRKAEPSLDLDGRPTAKRTARRSSRTAIASATTPSDDASALAISAESFSAAQPQTSAWSQFGDLFARAEDALVNQSGKYNREWVNKHTDLASRDEYIFWVDEAEDGASTTTSASAPPNSAPPQSAFPPNSALPITAAPRSAPPQSPFPQSAHPHSALTPRANLLAPDTPRSAHPLSATPSTPRRRHGPAVSAAWRSGSQSGKIRGRPPANRTLQDGPFSTFPVNPWPTPSPRSVSSSTAAPNSSTAAPSISVPAATANSALQTSSLPTGTAALAQPKHHPPNGTSGRKPSKLQLQVPQHQGGPVRLATPPPRILANGGTSAASKETTTTAMTQMTKAKQSGGDGAGGHHERHASLSSFTTGYGDDEEDSDADADADGDVDVYAEGDNIELAEVDDGGGGEDGNGMLDTFGGGEGSEARTGSRTRTVAGAGAASEAGEKVDWKRRALGLERRLKHKEAELRALKRRVMEAVM